MSFLMTRHSTIPSFMSAGKKDITKELAYKDGKYSLTLTDKNNSLSEYSFTSSDSNVKVSKSGNKLTITSKKAIDGKARITATTAVLLVGGFQAVQLPPGQAVQGVESSLGDAPDALHSSRCHAPDAAAVLLVGGFQLTQPLRCRVLQPGELAPGEIVQEGVPCRIGMLRQ